MWRTALGLPCDGPSGPRLVTPSLMLRRPSRARVTVRTLIVVLTLASASLVLGTWLYSVVP